MYSYNINIFFFLGYLAKISGYGSGFHKAMKKWYLNSDPIETTKQITRHRRYGGYTHKKVMSLIHLHSNNPSNQKQSTKYNVIISFMYLNQL